MSFLIFTIVISISTSLLLFIIDNTIIKYANSKYNFDINIMGYSELRIFIIISLIPIINLVLILINVFIFIIYIIGLFSYAANNKS